jgi:hypothetical protein
VTDVAFFVKKNERLGAIAAPGESGIDFDEKGN